MTLSRWASSFSALVLLGGSSLIGQSAEKRNGFWAAAGVGWGSFAVSCSTCGSASRETALALHLRLGGTVSPKLLLGGELIGWGKSESGHSVTAANATFSGYFYPMVESGLFFTAGVGASIYQQTTTISAIGTGFTLGAGYDIQLARIVSITPVAHYLWGSPGDVQNMGYTMIPGLKQNLFDIGIDATFH